MAARQAFSLLNYFKRTGQTESVNEKDVQESCEGCENSEPTEPSGGGQGGGSSGEKGQEAGGEGAGSGIFKVAGTGRKRVKFRNISLYFAMDMEHTGENR